MNASAKEEELQQRLQRIRIQNAELLQRYQEVEADKRMAAQSKALVGNHVTTNISDMMPAERDALREKNEPRANDFNKHENKTATIDSIIRNQKSQRTNQVHQRNRSDATESKMSHANKPKENTKKSRGQRNSRRSGPSKHGIVSQAPSVEHTPKVVQQSSYGFLISDDEDDDDDFLLFQDVAPLEPNPVIANPASRDNYLSRESLKVTYNAWEDSRSSHYSVGQAALATELLAPRRDFVSAAEQPVSRRDLVSATEQPVSGRDFVPCESLKVTYNEWEDSRSSHYSVGQAALVAEQLAPRRDFVSGAEQPITRRDLVSATEQPITRRDFVSATEQPITRRDFVSDTEQPITRRDLVSAAEQPITRRDFVSATEQPITRRDLVSATEQPITRRDLVSATEQPITRRDLVSATEQPITRRDLVSATEQPVSGRDFVSGYFPHQEPQRQTPNSEASVPVCETLHGIANRRSYSPTEGSTVPSYLQFVHNDFSVPPPALPKSFREPSPAVYGSGRLHTANFYTSGEQKVFPSVEPRYRESEHQNPQPVHPTLPPRFHQSEAPSGSHALYLNHPTGNPNAVHPSNARLPDSTANTHPGYPDRNNSPEQGHAQSYTYAPNDMPKGSSAPSGRRVIEQDVYSSTHGAFGGQFSAMGLPSINQMAQALDVLGDQRSQRHSSANYLDNNPNKGSYNSMPLAAPNQQEVVLNISGIQIPKTKAEELLKKTLAIAYGRSNMQPAKNIDLNNFEDENNDNGMELLTMILQSSNCDENEQRPLMEEHSSGNAAPINADRFARGSSAHGGHGEVRGYRPMHKGVSRPLLGRGDGDQQASGTTNKTHELESKSQFHAYNLDTFEGVTNHNGRRPVYGHGPPHQERAERLRASRPILGRCDTNEISSRRESTGRREYREPDADPLLALRGSVSDSDSRSVINLVEPPSASCDESSASLHSEPSESFATQNTPKLKKDRKERIRAQAPLAPPKKKSSIQARMEAVRNDSSKRFSRSHHISNAGGVMQLSFKGQTFEIGGATRSERAKESQPSSSVEAEGVQNSKDLDLHYKELREVGRPYESSSEPSRKPNSGVNTKPAALPLKNCDYTFNCRDVREKDKEAESGDMLEDQTETSHSLIQELTDKKSQLEEALEETKNENLMIEKQLKELRLQKNRVN